MGCGTKWIVPDPPLPPFIFLDTHVRNQQHQFTNRLPKSNEPDKDEGDLVLVSPDREKKPDWAGPSIIAAGPPRTKPTGGSRDAPSSSPNESSRDSREPTNSPSKSSRGD